MNAPPAGRTPPGMMLAPVLARRAIQAAAVFVLLTSTLFIFSHLPNDPVYVSAHRPASHDRLSAASVLDVVAQYPRYVAQVAQGDFGTSKRTFEPTRELVLRFLPVSLRLVVPALLIAGLTAVPLGLLAAVRRGALGSAVVLAARTGVSVPPFILGILVALLFGSTLRWFPADGTGGPEHLVLPVATLAAGPLACWTRVTYERVSGTLNDEFVRTARASGRAGTAAVRAHVLRSALRPLLTAGGLDIGALLLGVAVVEAIFGWYGLGALVVWAVEARDYPVMQAACLTLGLLVIAGGLLAEVACGLIDPHVRRGT